MVFTRPAIHPVRALLNQLFNPDTTTLTVGTSPTPPSSLRSDKKATSNTNAVQLVASATPARRVMVQAFASKQRHRRR